MALFEGVHLEDKPVNPFTFRQAGKALVGLVKKHALPLSWVAATGGGAYFGPLQASAASAVAGIASLFVLSQSEHSDFQFCDWQTRAAEKRASNIATFVSLSSTAVFGGLLVAGAVAYNPVYHDLTDKAVRAVVCENKNFARVTGEKDYIFSWGQPITVEAQVKWRKGQSCIVESHDGENLYQATPEDPKGYKKVASYYHPTHE